MKQHITPDQLNQLSPEAKEKLRFWFREKKQVDWISSTEVLVNDVFLPLLDIGQMIEFLTEKKLSKELRNGYGSDCAVRIPASNILIEANGLIISWEFDLCDTLWIAVKEVLNPKEVLENK